MYHICSSCGSPFDPHIPENKKHGYFSQCGSCGRKEDKKHPSRHMGIQGGEGINKSGNIAIVKNPSKEMARWVRNICKTPFNANLPFSSYSFVAGKEDKEDE